MDIISSMKEVGCIVMSVPYPTKGIVPSLTSQKSDVYQRQPRELDRLKVNETSLEDDSLLCSPSKIDKTLRRVITQGTSAEEIMKHSGIYTPTNDQFEYDIAIPSPPPNRRYKVTLKIRTIKKGKPTIVDSDWV